MRNASRQYRPETVTAATWVLLRRPAFWLVGIALLIQIGFLLSAMNSESRTSKSEANLPSYEPEGRKLWSVRDDLRLAFERDQADHSVSRLHLDFVRTSQAEGETLIQLGDQSSNSNNDIAVSTDISLNRFIKFLLRYHQVQWISLRREQLAILPADALNTFPKLRGVAFTEDVVTESDLQLLSRLKKIEHLTLEAGWCEQSLHALVDLPNLKSLHLKSRSTQRTRSPEDRSTPRLLSPENIASLQELKKLKEIAIEGDGQLFNYAFITGLTKGCRAEYQEVVEALRSLPILRSVYVGRFQNPNGGPLLARMAADLPRLTIHPATFDSSMAEIATLGNLATLLGLSVLTLHLVTCNSVAQNCLLNGANQAHLKVYLACVGVLLLMPTTTILLQTYAHWLPVITFEISLFALVTVFGMFRAAPVKVTGDPIQWWKTLTALLLFPVIGLVVFVWLGSNFYGLQVSKFFCGHYFVPCLCLLVSAVLLLVSHIQSFLNMHRFWAESGLSPAATWTEIQESVSRHKSFLQQGRDGQTGEEESAKRLGDPWLTRLRSLKDFNSQNHHNSVARCRLWLAAMISTSIPRAIFCLAVIWPLCGLWPVFYELFTVGPSALMDSIQLTFLTGMVTVIGSFMVFLQWHGRSCMYETEILRPVARSVWRDTVLKSMLFAVGVLTLIAWGEVYLIRLIAGQHLSMAWVALSLLSVVSATLLATGLNALALIQSRVVIAALMVLMALAGFIPLLNTTSFGAENSVSYGIGSYQIWVIIVVAEIGLGAAVLRAAWVKWGSMELANH